MASPQHGGTMAFMGQKYGMDNPPLLALNPNFKDIDKCF